jgi:hypothetical protein
MSKIITFNHADCLVIIDISDGRIFISLKRDDKLIIIYDENTKAEFDQWESSKKDIFPGEVPQAFAVKKIGDHIFQLGVKYE